MTWLPVDDAAAAILDLLKTSQTIPSPCAYINLVHPHPISWNKIFETAADRLELTLVPHDEWFKQLRSRKGSLVNGTAEASDLTEFFLQGKFGDGKFAMDHTLQLCPTLKEVKPLGSADVIKYLEFWKF